ncbi:MAG: PfkB family carbohydrate kinase [Thermomicrobiales bacterium]|nr:PfkB family carbohydrate kinase [Thermomicrobiales bacterium]
MSEQVELRNRVIQSIAKNPAIGVVGMCSWDTVLTVDTMPDPGGFAFVSSVDELPGGTSANAAVTAARLGARVELVSAVGDDPIGRRLVSALSERGVDTARVRFTTDEPTDQTTVITSMAPPNRTLFWRQGAVPRMGDPIDIDRLFTRNLVLLDSVDPALRRFLIDLPVHTYPDVKILVPMTYVVDFSGRDEIDSVVRCDALVGSENELQALTGKDSLETAITATQELIRVHNLRWVAVTRGAQGALAFDAHHVYRVPALPVEVVDTTGAGDAFAGAFGVGLACRLPLPDALALANCVAGLSVRSVGAQTSLPASAEAGDWLIRAALPTRD